MKKRLFTAITFWIVGTTPLLVAQKNITTNDNTKSGLAATKHINLERGEIVTLALAEDVRSETANVGDVIKMTATMDIHAQGYILIKKGSYGEAIVRDVKRGKGFGRGGRLVLEVDNITTFDGQRVLLQGKSLKIAVGEPRKKRAWGLVVSGIVVASVTGVVTLGASGFFCGMPMVALGIAVNGKEAFIQKGTIMVGTVKKTQEIDADLGNADDSPFKN